jgi:hypothetical protein
MRWNNGLKVALLLAMIAVAWGAVAWGTLEVAKPKPPAPTPVTTTASASQFRVEVPYSFLPSISCKGKPNCSTFSVVDAGEALLSVSPEGNVTVKGDLTVRGKISGTASTWTWATLLIGNLIGAVGHARRAEALRQADLTGTLTF